MFNDLTNLARAREREIRRQVSARNSRPRPDRQRRNRFSRLTRRALCRLGSWLVTIGRRLECYDLHVVGKSDYAIS